MRLCKPLISRRSHVELFSSELGTGILPPPVSPVTPVTPPPANPQPAHQPGEYLFNCGRAEAGSCEAECARAGGTFLSTGDDRCIPGVAKSCGDCYSN